MKITSATIIGAKLKFNSHKDHNPECDILEMVVNKDSFITYGQYVKGPKKGQEFFEYYSGENYVLGSNKKSYSRVYRSIKELPGNNFTRFTNLRGHFIAHHTK